MSEGDAGATTRRPKVATRARFYLVGAALLALVVAFAVFAAGWFEYSISQRTADLSRQVAALAKGQAVAASLPDTSAETRERLFQVEGGLIGAALFVTDESGRVLRSTVPAPPASLPLDRVTRAGASGTASGVLRNASGAQVLVVVAPVDTTQRLVAVQGLAEIRQGQEGLLLVGALALLFSAMVTYLAGGLLAGRLTAPIVALERAAEEVAAGAFGAQVGEQGDAETVSLARSFNRMSLRVADAYDAQKAFVGDVSHEIATPLTSIRGFSEALLDGTIADSDRQHRALQVIHDEAERIGELSRTLLSLAELDAGAVQVAREPVDVSVLADALKGRFAGAAEEAGIEFDVALGAGKPLGDADRLLQALTILATNALAYSPRGGRVRISAQCGGEAWLVCVDDSGPGIPPAERDAVFGRFTRLDRSRSTGSGGAGLGLPICRRLVELMGGSIRIGDSDLGGARFTIALSAAR